MSADRNKKAEKLSQPLVAAPMPEYEFQRQNDYEHWTYDQKPDDRDDRKLDLSGVVFNFK